MNFAIEINQLANNFVFIFSRGAFYPERFYANYRAKNIHEISLEEFVESFFCTDYTTLVSASIDRLRALLGDDKRLFETFFLVYIPSVASQSSMSKEDMDLVNENSRKCLFENILKLEQTDENIDIVYQGVIKRLM